MKNFETLHVGDRLVYMGNRTLKVISIKGNDATTRCQNTGLLETHSINHIKHSKCYQHITSQDYLKVVVLDK